MCNKVLGIYGAGGLGREILELAKIINDREKRWDSFIFIADGGTSNEVNGVKVLEYEEAEIKYGAVFDVTDGGEKWGYLTGRFVW